MRRFISGPWLSVTQWDRRVTARGVVSSISAMKATLGLSLRWPTRRPPGCASSTRSASPQPDGTATIRSVASGRPDLTCKLQRHHLACCQPPGTVEYAFVSERTTAFLDDLAK